MKKLFLALAFLGVTASAQAAAPFTFYVNSPKAGDPIRMTVNRSDSSSQASVILSTKDNTAKVNVDYDFSSVLVTFAPQQVAATILIPTHVTTVSYGQTLKVGLIVSVGSTAVASGLASIIEPATAPPPPTSWVNGPVQLGGYVWTKTNQPQGCCNGLVMKVVAGPIISGDADPNKQQRMWQLQFYSDVTHNFPVDDQYDVNFKSWWPESDIQGLTPAT